MIRPAQAGRSARPALLAGGLALILLAAAALFWFRDGDDGPRLDQAQVVALADDPEGPAVVAERLVAIARSRDRGLAGLGAASRHLRATVVLESRLQALGGFPAVLAAGNAEESGADLVAAAAAAWQEMGCAPLAALLREVREAPRRADAARCWSEAQAHARACRGAWMREHAAELAKGG